jgi:hypothetical protein
MLAAAFAATLPEAESHLDQIAREACVEADLSLVDPAPLLALVAQTRRLSA